MIHISQYAHDNLIKKLKEFDEVDLVPDTDVVYNEISSHADIYYCDLVKSFYYGDLGALGYKYPGDIIYNAACTGKFFIHNLKYTDPYLLMEAKAQNMILIDVKQGYTKCNTVIVDEDSIITSDRGIYKPCIEGGMNALLITEGHVILPGLNTGFLGGTCGLIQDTIYFNGNLEKHPDFLVIKDFIENRGLKVYYDTSYPLIDIGSILWER